MRTSFKHFAACQREAPLRKSSESFSNHIPFCKTKTTYLNLNRSYPNIRYGYLREDTLNIYYINIHIYVCVYTSNIISICTAGMNSGRPYKVTKRNRTQQNALNTNSSFTIEQKGATHSLKNIRPGIYFLCVSKRETAQQSTQQSEPAPETDRHRRISPWQYRNRKGNEATAFLKLTELFSRS